MTPPCKPLLCRARVRHHGELDKTSDGNTHIRRATCLKERWTGLDNGRLTEAAVITNCGSPHEADSTSASGVGPVCWLSASGCAARSDPGGSSPATAGTPVVGQPQ